MDESLIRASILFFLVTLEDESRVYPASEAAITAARRRKHKHENAPLLTLLVEEATAIYTKGSFKTLSARRPLEFKRAPSRELLNQMRSLRSHVSNSLFIPFVWNEVVKVKKESIAEALKISEGTVDQRSYEVLKAWAAME